MYEGQPATCIRCHEPVIGGCLGGGVRKKCRELVPEILRDSEQWERKKNMEKKPKPEEECLEGEDEDGSSSESVEGAIADK